MGTPVGAGSGGSRSFGDGLANQKENDAKNEAFLKATQNEQAAHDTNKAAYQKQI